MSIHFYTGAAWKAVQSFNLRNKGSVPATKRVNMAQITDGTYWYIFYQAGGNITSEYVGEPQSSNPANIDKYNGYRKGVQGVINRGQFISGVEVLRLFQYENGAGIGFADGFHLSLGADLQIGDIAGLEVEMANGPTVFIPAPTDQAWFAPWDGTQTSWVFFYDLRNNYWVPGQNYNFEIILP
ncbi:MAG: hypothetical protein DRP64_00100 [Verrucomicrobia bacterium]|nr:MAG: hypothetical protein DRP64_00100 [Verrucomicrobiota bacterium]